MTLTLDEVRNTKFHMARRAGYEVTDVDLFVDRVEASFAQLVEENQMLKRQIEALKASQGDSPVSTEEDGSDDTIRQPAPAAVQPEAAAPQVATAAAGEGAERIVVTTGAEASPAVVRLVQLATEQAESLLGEAQAEARRTREDAQNEAKQTVDQARREAHEITTDARTKAERVESEARVNAERVRNEAAAKASDVEREAAERRTALFTELEQERDTLKASVRELREFEAEYRRTFTQQLQEQLDRVTGSTAEPSGSPVLLDEDADDDAEDESPAGRRGHEQPSSTPRLDALIRDNS
ncbi:DivIVA domain-containing protein [Auraticoccus sp. F435]|uniref:Cell wall synthesis protein Wag31 n=1 Tax=Auraticoccus cholistanensis TaxID=2656650 RepID=A0A6A9UZJ2_9ACTN|nr:DivIVA domain-containing protein [Auraticoccus cholistanensis]MVA77287.1 DivIVA domain-containing protein [Auraticoccus cholistanensis]